MRRQTFSIAVVAMMAIVLLAAGCTKSDPVAPGGSKLTLSASPSDIQPGGTSTLQAIVFDPSGVPLEAVDVFFSANNGSLASGGAGRLTDENGIANDFLTTNVSTQVTAQSGDTSSQVTVTVGGQPLVGSIDLNAVTPNPPQGNAPLTVVFLAVVRDTLGTILRDVTLSIQITNGDGTKDPTNPVTDTNGEATFSIKSITIDGTTVTVSAGGVSSSPVVVTILPN